MSDLNLNVAMIGPRGCGKTSVLSIMLGELQNFIDKLNNKKNVKKYCSPKLGADDFSIQILHGVYQSLQSVQTRNVLKDGVGVVMGNGDHNIYNIDLSVSGVSTTISFHDFPGGYFLPESRKHVHPKRLDECRDVFENADVIILCVDVPSQISNPLPQNKALYESYTGYITELIKDVASTPSANQLRKTVIILPVKCEGVILDTTPGYGDYTQSINQDKNDHLYDSVKSLYKDLFTFLEDPNATVYAFYLPVITMGCVKARGVEYDEEDGVSRIRFEPVIKGYDLKYYQCNSTSLTALCLWSAEKIITQKYIASANFLAKAKVFFGGVWPTQWFRDQLFEECSLHKILWDYIRSQPDYAKLSDEAKQHYAELRAAAEKQPFTGCRLI